MYIELWVVGNFVEGVSFDYATRDGSAVEGTDYGQIEGDGTARFAPGTGQPSQIYNIPIIDDSIVQDDHTFYVDLSNPVSGPNDDFSLINNLITFTIRDNDRTISINDVVVDEDAGTADFELTLSEAAAQPVSVTFSTADGSAEEPDDYTETTQTKTFAPGVTTIPISIPIIDDSILEPDEEFFVNLTSAERASIGDGQGKATIRSNELQATTTAVNDGQYEVTRGVAFHGDVSTNDTFQGTPTFQLTDSTGVPVTEAYSINGELDWDSSDGTFTFTANSDLAAGDIVHLYYKITDSGESSNIAQIEFRVVNSAPTAEPYVVVARSGSTVTIPKSDLLAKHSDDSGAAPMFHEFSELGPQYDTEDGNLTATESGDNITITASATFADSVIVPYFIRDAEGGETLTEILLDFYDIALYEYDIVSPSGNVPTLKQADSPNDSWDPNTEKFFHEPGGPSNGPWQTITDRAWWDDSPNDRQNIPTGKDPITVTKGVTPDLNAEVRVYGQFLYSNLSIDVNVNTVTSTLTVDSQGTITEDGKTFPAANHAITPDVFAPLPNAVDNLSYQFAWSADVSVASAPYPIDLDLTGNVTLTTTESDIFVLYSNPAVDADQNGNGTEVTAKRVDYITDKATGAATDLEVRNNALPELIVHFDLKRSLYPLDPSDLITNSWEIIDSVEDGSNPQGADCISLVTLGHQALGMLGADDGEIRYVYGVEESWNLGGTSGNWSTSATAFEFRSGSGAPIWFNNGGQNKWEGTLFFAGVGADDQWWQGGESAPEPSSADVLLNWTYPVDATGDSTTSKHQTEGLAPYDTVVPFPSAPPLVGLTVSLAHAAISAKGFSPVTFLPDGVNGSDIVNYQYPAGGTMLLPGTKVYVGVSSDPGTDASVQGEYSNYDKLNNAGNVLLPPQFLTIDLPLQPVEFDEAEIEREVLLRTFESAKTSWASIVIDDVAQDRLSSATVESATLPYGRLGVTNGLNILIDDNASSFGWSGTVSPRNELGNVREGTFDLFTVLVHELGHVLGLKDLIPTFGTKSIMTATLGLGDRRIANEGDLYQNSGEVLRQHIDIDKSDVQVSGNSEEFYGTTVNNAGGPISSVDDESWLSPQSWLITPHSSILFDDRMLLEDRRPAAALPIGYKLGVSPDIGVNEDFLSLSSQPPLGDTAVSASSGSGAELGSLAYAKVDAENNFSITQEQ